MPEMPSRVELCPLTLSDRDEFCSLVRASAELHRPWVQLPATAEKFRTWRDHERWAITAPDPWTPDPSLPEV